jgi:hypothetical protein
MVSWGIGLQFWLIDVPDFSSACKGEGDKSEPDCGGKEFFFNELHFLSPIKEKA